MKEINHLGRIALEYGICTEYDSFFLFYKRGTW